MRKIILRICFLFWALFIGGFCYYLYSIPSPATDFPKADAIVVLTGGKGRVQEGIRLLSRQQAEKMLISGVGSGVNLEDLLSLQPANADEKQAAREQSGSISLGRSADSTSTNAQETKEWMEKQRFKSLLLVTANYHMPRSLMEFSSLMPEMKIYPAPVAPDDFHFDRWWTDAKSAKLLFLEYFKLVAAWIRIHQ